MHPAPANSRIGRFGPYEVDVCLGEVRKLGLRIKLGEQPLQILILLIERQGQLVTRDELRNHLWSDDTFVDFDHSLNSAVQRLREGLSDTAQKGRWIETIPRRGYRFAGNVEWISPSHSAPGVALPDQAPVEPKTGVPAPVQSHPLSAHPENRWRSWVPYALAAVLLFLAAGIGMEITLVRRSKAAAGSIRSLAVLPLENLSGDASQDYFADGMTDELITALAKNRGLRVISRTSVMQFKGVRRPVREIARELGVQGILEGSISRAAGRVHLNVQLVDARSDAHIWADTYDRDVAQTFSLPVELSQTIAKELKVAGSTSSPHYINTEAHDYYLRGRFFFFGDNDAPGIEYLQKAVVIQPDYAAAWSAISAYYGARAVEGAMPPGQVRAIWENDARKAIELDDSLSDSHNSLAAWYFFGQWDWQRALAESERAVALDPNNAEAWHIYSYILTVLNRPEQALEAQKRGMEVDPYARPWALGMTYYHLRQFDAAIVELRMREQAKGKNSFLHWILADALGSAGREQDAVDEWAQLSLMIGDPHTASGIRKAFALGGYKSVTEWQLARYKAPRPGQYVSPLLRAFNTARAQHKNETLQLLEDAYRERSPRLVFLQNEPLFDFLHSEPRYQAIVRQMGLPVIQ